MPARRRKPALDPEAAALLTPPRAPDDTVIIKGSSRADEDTETVLSELQIYQAERWRWTSDNGDLNQEYERLRNKATELLVDGPRYFLDHNGVKQVAVRGQAEPVRIDPEILEYLSPAVVEKVAPRKIDTTAFKRAVARQDVPTKLFVKYAKVHQSAPFVRFIRADADIDAEG